MSEIDPKDEYHDKILIENTPGLVGYILDDEFMPNVELDPIADFNWIEYAEVAVSVGAGWRTLLIKFDGGVVRVEADAGFLGEFLDGLPAIEGIYFNPPHQGPAGRSGTVFVVADGWTKEQVKSQTIALRGALDADLKKLRAILHD